MLTLGDYSNRNINGFAIQIFTSLLLTDLTCSSVIPSRTLSAANLVKVVIRSTYLGMDSETDAHCTDVIFPLICDNPVINCRAAVWPLLLVAALH